MAVSVRKDDVALTGRNLERLAFVEKVATEVGEFARDAFDRRGATRGTLLQVLDAVTALLVNAEALAATEDCSADLEADVPW